MSPERDEYETKLRRMLLWFESQLPPHDLGVPRVVYYEETVLSTPPDEHWLGGFGGHFKGRVACRRCGQTFEWQNPAMPSTARDKPDRLVAEVQKVAERLAASSRCWGDVPRLPDASGFVAVADFQFQESSTTEQP